MIKNNLINYINKKANKSNVTKLTNAFDFQLMEHANCYKALKGMPSDSVDLVVTDPPYDYNHKSTAQLQESEKHTNRKYRHLIRSRIKINRMSDGVNLHELMNQLVRVTKHLNLVMFCSGKQIRPILDYVHNLHVSQLRTEVLMWIKTNGSNTSNGFYMKDCEYIIVCYDKKYIHVNGWASTHHHSFLTPTNLESGELHYPAVKYVFMLRDLIINQSNMGDTVIDPFTGSGSTGVASRAVCRNFIGMDINQDAYKITLKRLSQSHQHIQKVIDHEISRLHKPNTKFYWKQEHRTNERIKKVFWNHLLKYRVIRLVQNIKSQSAKRSSKSLHQTTYSHYPSQYRYYIRKNKNNPNSKYYHRKIA